MKKNLFINEEKIKKEILLKLKPYGFNTLHQKNNIGLNALMFSVRYLNLTEEQWDYLIHHSDLTQKNEIGGNILMDILSNYEKQNLHFTKEQWNYLIENSKLEQQNKNGFNAFSIMLLVQNNDKFQNLFFLLRQREKFWNALHEGKKQKTFEILIQKYQNTNLKKEDILFMLYDLKFQPNQKTIHFLKKNNYQEIIQMIEKRDIFLNLNKGLIQENNKKNGLKI
jgi:hypothetical protein